MLNFKRLKYLCRRTVQILVDHSNLIPYHAVVDGCNGIRKGNCRSIVRCRCKTNCLLLGLPAGNHAPCNLKAQDIFRRNSLCSKRKVNLILIPDG